MTDKITDDNWSPSWCINVKGYYIQLRLVLLMPMRAVPASGDPLKGSLFPREHVLHPRHVKKLQSIKQWGNFFFFEKGEWHKMPSVSAKGHESRTDSNCGLVAALVTEWAAYCRHCVRGMWWITKALEHLHICFQHCWQLDFTTPCLSARIAKQLYIWLLKYHMPSKMLADA